MNVFSFAAALNEDMAEVARLVQRSLVVVHNGKRGAGRGSLAGGQLHYYKLPCGGTAQRSNCRQLAGHLTRRSRGAISFAGRCTSP